MRDFRTPFNSVFKNLSKGSVIYLYKNIPCLKSPLDIAIYMHLLWLEKPKPSKYCDRFGIHATYHPNGYLRKK